MFAHLSKTSCDIPPPNATGIFDEKNPYFSVAVQWDKIPLQVPLRTKESNVTWQIKEFLMGKGLYSMKEFLSAASIARIVKYLYLYRVLMYSITT